MVKLIFPDKLQMYLVSESPLNVFGTTSMAKQFIGSTVMMLSQVQMAKRLTM